jgi:hypothetical protein
MKHIKKFNESIEDKNYQEIDFNEFEIKKKKRTFIPSESIIEMSKLKGEKWIRGWIGGRQTFNFDSYGQIDEEFLASKEESKLILLKVVISGVRVVDMDIYYLNTGEYLVQCSILFDPYRHFILKNITDLNTLLEECIRIVSKEYPRILN